jgi:chorismate mutase
MEEISKLQAEIDDIDRKLIDLLRERFVRSREIGTIKRRENQPSFDPARARSVRQRFVEKCVEVSLDAGMADRLISLLVEQVILERAQR